MIENEFADASQVPQDWLEQIGIASTSTCPECRSVLYKIRDERALRFRCQLGHGFSAKTLLQDLAAAREDALWSAVRAVRCSKKPSWHAASCKVHALATRI